MLLVSLIPPGGGGNRIPPELAALLSARGRLLPPFLPMLTLILIVSPSLKPRNCEGPEFSSVAEVS